MRRFLFYILCFFAAVAIVDVAFGIGCRWLNSHARGGDTAEHYAVAMTQTQPVVILGSSRAAHHYNPAILEDSLGSGVYNCGEDGNGILFHFGRLSLMMQRYTPELVIYDALPGFDIEHEDNTKYLAWLRRWAGEECLDTLFSDISPLEPLKLHSSLYRYNKSFLQMAMDCVKPAHHAGYHGYRPLPDTMAYAAPVYDRPAPEWDELKLKYFTKLIEMCRRHGTKLVVVYSPYYRAVSSDMLTPITRLCQEMGVPVIDRFADAAFVNDSTLFEDASHLNAPAADRFTSSLSTQLKGYIHQFY